MKNNLQDLQLDDDILKDPRLINRGIAQSAYVMKWTSKSSHWVYPVLDFDGNILTYRTKTHDSHAKYKYKWKPSKLDAKYYHHPEIRQHIADNNGELFIANGEPSVLAYHSAGIYNVLSWFGESSIPNTIIEDLKQLGVTSLIYAPDNDEAGRKSAIKLRDLLHNTDIQLTVLDISAQVDRRGDTNDLWIHVEFDRSHFIDVLSNCPPLVLPTYNPPKQKQNYDNMSEDFNSLIENVAKAYGIWGQSRNKDGWTRKNFSSPFRDDKNPSASFNFDSGVLNDFSDKPYSLFQQADHLNIEYRRASHAIPQASNMNAIPDDDSSDKRKCIHCGNSIEHRHPSAKYCNDSCKKAYKAHQKNINNPIVIDSTLIPVRLAKPTIYIRNPYVSDMDIDPLLDAKTVGILSPTGTGKTVLIKRYIDRLKQRLGRPVRVLQINHRRALSRDLANRLGMQCYLDMDSIFYSTIDELVICINSLHKLMTVDGLPQYDAIILDEPQHLLTHLMSATFKGNEAVNAYKILCYYIKTTPYLLTLDAHLSKTIIETIEHIRDGKVTVIENTYRKNKGTVNIYFDVGKALETAIAKAGKKRKLVVPCETVALSQTAYEYLCDLYGCENVLLINKNTSSNPDVTQFLSNPDNGLSQYRAIVHTATIDSGVSFDSVPAVVCGLFNGSADFVASDIIQMIARVRNPIDIVLYVAQRNRTERTTDTISIYEDALATARRNNALITIDDNGKVSITKEHKQLLHIQSKLQRDRNTQLNNHLNNVIAYLKYDGYTPQLHSGKNQAVNQILNDKRDDHAEHMKQLRLDPDTSPLSKQDYDDLRDDSDYTLTDIDHAGRDKDQVLNAVGDMEYTAQLDSDLIHPRSQQKLYALTDLYSDAKYLNQCDIEDVDLLHKQKYRTLNQHLNKQAIRALFSTDDLDQAVEIVLTAKELDTGLTQFVDDNRKDLKHIGIDASKYKTAIRLIRAILDRIGVKLIGKLVRINSETRERHYQIDSEHLTRWLAYKDSRQAMIAEFEAEYANTA
jgi:hypothetical protein